MAGVGSTRRPRRFTPGACQTHHDPTPPLPPRLRSYDCSISVWSALALGVSFLAACATIAWVIRRVLGVSSGLIRRLLVSALVLLTTVPVVNALLEPLGIMDSDGALTAPTAVLVTVLVLSSLWMLVAAWVLMVVLEVVAPTGTVPGPATLVADARRWVRRNRRYQSLWWLISRSSVAALARRGPAAPGFGKALAEVMGQAGVTFVKFGQMLATREDLVPASTARALASLQTAAPAEKPGVAEQVVEQQLGKPITEVFTHFSTQPLASASVAQVHTATLKDGQEVVVKFQRPSARAEVLVDGDILRRITRTAAARFQWARDIDLVALTDGMVNSIVAELDYHQEAENTTAVERSTKDPAIHIPRIYPQYSTEQVLVMDKLNGVPIGEAQQQVAALSAEQRTALAQSLLGFVLDGVFVHGVFHTDLHPGNILLLEDGNLGIIDFGSVGVLDDELRLLLATLVFAILNDDCVAATDALTMAMTVPPDTDRTALQRELGREITLLQYRADINEAFFSRIFAIIRAHRIAVPPHLAATLLAVAGIIGSVVLLGYNDGPMLTDSLSLAGVVGGFLAFFSSALALRSVMRVFSSGS